MMAMDGSDMAAAPGREVNESLNRFRVLLQEVRLFLKSRPSVFVPIASMRRESRNRLVRSSTEILIDGFPRSANTFAVAAFRYSQQRPIEIAHHHHCSAQFALAVQHDVPAVLVIRQPQEAIRSHLTFFPWMPAHQAVRQYLTFHSEVEIYRERLVVAPFDLVTSDFGSVVDAVNDKFGKTFRRFVHTPAAANEIREQLRTENEKRRDPEYRFNGQSAVKEELKKRVTSSLESPDLRGILEEANDIYSRLAPDPSTATTLGR